MLNDGRNKENRPKDNIKALQERMKRFGLAVIHMTEKLPSTRAANVISAQIIRSGTSPGANYRAACRARSKAEFIAKMGIVEEELNETLYRLEVLVDTRLPFGGRRRTTFQRGQRAPEHRGRFHPDSAKVTLSMNSIDVFHSAFTIPHSALDLIPHSSFRIHHFR